MRDNLSVHTDSRPTVGLVLGAGGILGCAHAGVIQVLREANVPIDCVVGASVGSVFGLGLAAGWPTEELVRVVRETNAFELFRFYAGRLRPGKTNPIARMLHDAGGGKTFDDLDMPFAVLATDMATGKPTLINSGPVLPAVQASIALPFISRPVGLGGSHYLDGGLMDTAPVWAAREMGADRVIAVCLGGNYTAPRFVHRRPWTRTVLERVGRQPVPIRGRFRDQVRFGCRLFTANLNGQRPAEDADVAIWPQFDGLGANSMFASQFTFARGVQAAEAALPAILAMTASAGRESELRAK
ncbi:MAG: hypothetical protein NVSMB52_00220 [Chloroflexota bacterium]